MTFLRMLFVCPVICALAQTPPPVPPETVVLRAGDVKLTAAQFDALADSLPAQYKAFAQGAGRKQFADQIARVLVLAQEGRRRKLDEEPGFQIQSKYRSEELLANLTQTAIKDGVKIDDATLREYYEVHKPEYERVRARHILIRMHGSPVPLKAGSRDLTDAEALAKARELQQKAHEDFAKTATYASDDDGSAMNGGDLGWFARGQMVPSFEETAFQLQPGQVSEPVKSPFGYHIIKVEGYELKSFDEVKGDIETKIRPERTQTALDELQEHASIDYDATFFGLPRKP